MTIFDHKTIEEELLKRTNKIIKRVERDIHLGRVDLHWMPRTVKSIVLEHIDRETLSIVKQRKEYLEVSYLTNGMDYNAFRQRPNVKQLHEDIETLIKL